MGKEQEMSSIMEVESRFPVNKVSFWSGTLPPFVTWESGVTPSLNAKVGFGFGSIIQNKKCISILYFMFFLEVLGMNWKKFKAAIFALDLSLTAKVYKARMESNEQVAELGANSGVVGFFLELLNLKLGLD